VKTARSVLNELRWRKDRRFSMVEVEYVHRGAPGDLASVGGGDILSLEPWMMVIRRRRLDGGEATKGHPAGPVPGQAAIPYHRIVRILYDGMSVFDRKAREREGRGERPSGGESFKPERGD
jgi:uncharacterized protein (UPF0248 family)